MFLPVECGLHGAYVIKDDGNWVADPSRLKSGDLKAWRDKIYEKYPNPNVGEIVVVINEKQGKMIGYKALTSEGYDTRWLRVSSVELKEHLARIEALIQDSNSALFGRIDILLDDEIKFKMANFNQ